MATTHGGFAPPPPLPPADGDGLLAPLEDEELLLEDELELLLLDEEELLDEDELEEEDEELLDEVEPLANVTIELAGIEYANALLTTGTGGCASSVFVAEVM